MACSRLSWHIQPNVNNPDKDGAANLLNKTAQHLNSQTRVWTKYNCNGHELSQPAHCLLWKTLATLVYFIVDSGLTTKHCNHRLLSLTSGRRRGEVTGNWFGGICLEIACLNNNYCLPRDDSVDRSMTFHVWRNLWRQSITYSVLVGPHCFINLSLMHTLGGVQGWSGVQILFVLHATVLWVPTFRPIEREGGATAVIELQHVDARVAQRKNCHNLSAWRF